jgi:hypothetical protein
VNQWNIGDVKISRIVESEGPWDGTFILPDATRENMSATGFTPHFPMRRESSK